MKLVLSAIFFLALTNQAIAKKTFGKNVDKTKVMKISTLLADAKKYEGKEVTVSGMITNVCSMRGCWLELASDKKFQTLRLKVKDGVMVFPVNSKGKLGYASGTLSSKTMSKEKLIALAEYQAKTYKKKVDISKITGPKTFYQFNPTGVEIE
jgi:hypothetical protein